MSAVEIHRATGDDIEELASIHVQAWQWAYRGLMPDEVLDSLDVERRANSWYRMLSEQRVPAPHVATVDSRLVGFVHANSTRDEGADHEIGEVTALYLHPECVGTGLGHCLWEAALA
ncbi:GNAT family N-acetyltransferase [Arthrobacter castelli]|uniref:GNAT family N-acetyltransferase n=1 Tax=Arthrobacter castelli TaxID=271431 RepID=UPI000409E836|nr:GNAT family N-acetyltransferase [Arthrobacter castelli]